MISNSTQTETANKTEESSPTSYYLPQGRVTSKYKKVTSAVATILWECALTTWTCKETEPLQTVGPSESMENTLTSSSPELFTKDSPKSFSVLGKLTTGQAYSMTQPRRPCLTIGTGNSWVLLLTTWKEICTSSWSSVTSAPSKQCKTPRYLRNLPKKLKCLQSNKSLIAPDTNTH